MKINSRVEVFKYNYYRLESITSHDAFNININVNDNEEALLFALQGSINVDNIIKLDKFDMYYLPPGTSINASFHPNTIAFIAYSWGEVKYKPYIKRYNEGKRIKTGVPPYSRAVITMIGEEDPANSFIAGYVEGEPGNWTSYPPHKHDEKPEAYIFYGLSPGFAVQLVISDEFEEADVVHDYDVVLIPKGYHPNFPTTINSVNYAWIIAAPKGKRDLTVDFHPNFKDLPMGPQSHIRSR